MEENDYGTLSYIDRLKEKLEDEKSMKEFENIALHIDGYIQKDAPEYVNLKEKKKILEDRKIQKNMTQDEAKSIMDSFEYVENFFNSRLEKHSQAVKSLSDNSSNKQFINKFQELKIDYDDFYDKALFKNDIKTKLEIADIFEKNEVNLEQSSLSKKEIIIHNSLTSIEGIRDLEQKIEKRINYEEYPNITSK